MKKFLYIVLSISLLACGGGGGDEPPPPPPANRAPAAPGLIGPANNVLCIDNNLTFQWSSATDPDGDSVTYQIQIATDNTFTTIIQSLTVSSTSQSLTLDRGVAYYWRVKAIDSKNLSGDFSSTYHFYTEGDGISNHLPFAPELVAPSLHHVFTGDETETTLEWTASDVDTADILSYDVYFGTDNPPTTTVATNQSATTYVAALTAAQTYYWKIVVKDGNGGETIGQIWTFKID